MKFFKVIAKIIVGIFAAIGALVVGGIGKAAYDDHKKGG